MPSKPVFGFYASWSRFREGRGQCNVSDIDPRLCTHLIYAFAQLDNKGSIAPLDESEQGTMHSFNNLRNQNSSLKTLISFGGAMDGETFSGVAGSSQLRATFAKNVCDFCAIYGFSGVDIDWQFPTSDNDRENFVQLLSALSSELHSHGLILTTTVGANRRYDVNGVARYADYILLMTYNYNGSWDSYTGHNAPLFRGQEETAYQRENLNVDASVNYWIRGGVPRSKLIVGLAAYGHTFTLSSDESGTRVDAEGDGHPGQYTKEAGTLAYYEVKETFGSRYIWDDEQCVPYAVAGDQWVSYDNEESIRLKCEYINKEGLGGAMIWSIDQDDFQAGYPLLRTVTECL